MERMMKRLAIATLLLLSACEQKDICEFATSNADLACLTVGISKQSTWDMQDCNKAVSEAWAECAKVPGGVDHYCSRLSDRDRRCPGFRARYKVD